MKRSASEPGLIVVGGQDNFRRALMIFGAKACLFVKIRSEMKIYFPKTSCAWNFSFLKVMSLSQTSLNYIASLQFCCLPFNNNTIIKSVLSSTTSTTTTTTTFSDCQPHHYLPPPLFCCFTEVACITAKEKAWVKLKLQKDEILVTIIATSN